MKKRPQIFELIVSADNTAALARGLTEKKAEINAAVDLRGMSLLRAACELHMDSRKGRWDVIRVLLEHGANPNIRWMDPVRVEYAKSMSDRHIPYSGEILVDYVVSRAVTTPNALELLKLLVEVWSLAIFVPCPPGRNTPSPRLTSQVGKADVNAVRHDGKSVLRTACSGCCWEVAQWLLWEVAVADAESFAIACAHGQVRPSGSQAVTRCMLPGHHLHRLAPYPVAFRAVSGRWRGCSWTRAWTCRRAARRRACRG